MKEIIPEGIIQEKIFLLRGHKVMLSIHLAELYGVEVRVLIQAVKRNIERFPDDFMFQLSDEEYKNLKSRFVISSWGGARRAKPYAFSEQGVAMLSSVLRSRRAIRVNIAIMRTFVKLRQLLSLHKEFFEKLKEIEQRIQRHDEEIKSIFEAIHRLMSPPEVPKRKIGFHTE